MKRLWNWKTKGLVFFESEFSDEDLFSKALVVNSRSVGINCSRLDSYYATVNLNGIEKEYYIVPDPSQPITNIYYGDARIGLASWSTNQENALDFLNELMTNSEIANYFTYGIENEDYEVDQDNYIQPYPTNSYVQQLWGNYYANPLAAGSTENMAEDKVQYSHSFFEDYNQNIPIGFRFDHLPAADDLNRVVNLYCGYKDPKNNTDYDPVVIKFFICGFDDEEDFIDTMSQIEQKLEEADIGRVVEEANRQLETWRKEQTNSD